MRIIRREIRVGNRVVVGAVCNECPTIAVIYPIEALKDHLLIHAQRTAAPEYGHDTQRPHRGGRIPGVHNRMSMSATGVEKRNVTVRMIARCAGRGK